MKLLVAARRALLPTAGADPGAAGVLLLEGAVDAENASTCWSLDESIDQRFAWIDREAADTAARLVERDQAAAGNEMSPLDVNALDLRYYLVKLLRVVAWFTGVRPLRRGAALELHAEAQRDADYADLLAEVCRLTGAQFTVCWRPSAAAPAAFPENSRARRWAGRLLRWVEPRRGAGQPRVALCGNPRLLDPVCRELLACGAQVWWLYDRFPWHSWLRWRWRGVGHLTCDASLGQENRLQTTLPERVACHGVNLSGALTHWLARRLAEHGPRQTRLAEQIERHFRRVQPQALVLDEDATPMARIAEEHARRIGAASLVLQHGAPCCRFGFAPLAADRILVWGRSSRNQLMRWDVPGDQIAITGSPLHDRLRERLLPLAQRARKPPTAPRLLLLTTVPPRDARPDAVTMHLTVRSYHEMIGRAFAAAARIAGARLIVKLHPRAQEDPAVTAAAARFPNVPVEIVRQARLEDLLARCDCALSCGSSAGVDATLSGRPVIQLLPAGALELLSEDPWGFTATTRTAAELDAALAKALRLGPLPPDPHAFGAFDAPALERVAGQVVQMAKQRRHPMTNK